MPFPKNTADMKVVQDLIAKIKCFGLSDIDIACAIGMKNNKNAIASWRHGQNATFPRNQDFLKLVLDLAGSIGSIVGPEHQKEYIREFFTTCHRSLENSTPGQYLHRHGITAREDLTLSAKNYAHEILESRKAQASYDDARYALMHIRLDIDILKKHQFDTYDIAEVLGKDRRRVDALVSDSGRQAQPTRLEARQLRQAATAAVTLSQHHHPRAVKGLMFASSVKYQDFWKKTIGSPQSIIDIISSQREGDTQGNDHAAFRLGHIMSKLTGKP